MVRPQHAVVAGVALMAAQPGCLYLGDINERPAIEIVRVTQQAIQRGASVELTAQIHDPDSGSVTLAWRAYACAESTSQCDDLPFAESSAISFLASVPVITSAHQPVQHVRITLEAADDRGATARPAQVLELDVVNAVPQVTALQLVGAATVVATPLELRARWVDADDALEDVTLTWRVFGPVGSAHPELTRLPSSIADVERQQLVPDVTGAWTIAVTARDPVGASSTVERAIVVVADRPPCLATLAPAADSPLVLDLARRFSVLTVDDDLDAYPMLVGPAAGAPQFSWSLLAPSRGPARVPLVGVGSNAVELDPAAFVAGELVELRVEIADRVPRAGACDDAAATCSIERDPCTQRQTWRLEIR